MRTSAGEDTWPQLDTRQGQAVGELASRARVEPCPRLTATALVATLEATG